MSEGGAGTGATKACPYCGEPIRAVARKCRHCDEYLDEQPRAREQTPDAVERMLLPVGRPPSAIVAGYLGLFSLLPCFGVLAIVAGLVALRSLNRHPDLSGRGRAIFGLAMGTVMTVLYGIPIVMAIVEGLRASRGMRP